MGSRAEPRYVPRFGRTERALHWVHAAAFFALLGTGLILWIPEFSTLVARRNLIKDVHIWVAVAWAIALMLVVLVGDRRTLRADWREIETIDRDDRRWLIGRKTPQGRFNAGQKINVIVTSAFALLFAVSGVLLWLSARDSRFRWEGPIVVHDALTYISIVLVLGHLYLAVLHPATRHALRGITHGDVREDWARAHHAKWAQSGDDTVTWAEPFSIQAERSPAEQLPSRHALRSRPHEATAGERVVEPDRVSTQACKDDDVLAEVDSD